MHEAVTYNRYYEKFLDFREASLNFFKRVGRRKALLRKRITDKFQIIDAPIFAS